MESSNILLVTQLVEDSDEDHKKTIQQRRSTHVRKMRCLSRIQTTTIRIN